MTVKQILICMLIGFFCSTPIPDPLTIITRGTATALLILVALLFVRNTDLIKNANGKIQKVVVCLTTISITLFAHVVGLYFGFVF
jgi:hypothetical protein